MSDMPAGPPPEILAVILGDAKNAKPFVLRRPGSAAASLPAIPFDERWRTTRGMNTDRELSARMAGSSTQEAQRRRSIGRLTTGAAQAAAAASDRPTITSLQSEITDLRARLDKLEQREHRKTGGSGEA